MDVGYRHLYADDVAVQGFVHSCFVHICLQLQLTVQAYL